MSDAPAKTTVLLASASPRRRDLLEQISVPYRVLPADIDESARPGEAPGPYVLRIAEEKVLAVSPMMRTGEVVLGADTAVVLDDQMLGKPEDETEAVEMLRLLSDRTHSVFTAVCVLASGSSPETRLNISEVSFARLDDVWIEAYVATGEPLDKAGAYGIQGWAGSQIRKVEGSYSSIMGLPLYETARLLSHAGLDLPQIPRTRG